MIPANGFPRTSCGQKSSGTSQQQGVCHMFIHQVFHLEWSIKTTHETSLCCHSSSVATFAAYCQNIFLLITANPPPLFVRKMHRTKAGKWFIIITMMMILAVGGRRLNRGSDDGIFPDFRFSTPASPSHNNKESKLMIRLFSCHPLSARTAEILPTKLNKSSIFRIHSISHFRHFTFPHRYSSSFLTTPP